MPKWIRWGLAVVGAAATALGGLWLLQGLDVVHLDPVACVGDCRPVSGWTPKWQAAGAVTIAVGVALMVWSLRGRRKRATLPD